MTECSSNSQPRIARLATVTGAPRPVGPYSTATIAQGFVFTSGQIPIDPSSGELLKGDIASLTDAVLTALEKILTAAGCTFADVVKTTIYLVDLAQFPQVNEVYQRRVGPSWPARTTIEVANLPLGAPIEIEMIACAKAAQAAIAAEVRR